MHRTIELGRKKNLKNYSTLQNTGYSEWQRKRFAQPGLFLKQHFYISCLRKKWMDSELGSLPNCQHTEFQASLGYITSLHQKYRKRELSLKESQELTQKLQGRRQICEGQSSGSRADKSWRGGCMPHKLQIASSSTLKASVSQPGTFRTEPTQMKCNSQRNSPVSLSALAIICLFMIKHFQGGRKSPPPLKWAPKSYKPFVL